MAGLEDASLTIQTLRPVDYFPANDVLHHYLPVPTSFTFASTCTDQWMFMDFITQTDLNNLFPTSCLPNGGPDAYNSPGTCVSGHHIVALTEFRTARWTTGGLRAWGAVCCRDGMSFDADDAIVISCRSRFTTPVTATTSPRFVPTAGDMRSTRVLDEGTQFMDPMFVYWQETDLSKFDPAYAATLAKRLDIDFTPTATSDTALRSDRSQFTSATSPANDGGEMSSKPDLSIAAKAGIGVGVAIAAILMVVTGLILYRRYGRKKASLDRKAALQNEQPELVQTRAA